MTVTNNDAGRCAPKFYDLRPFPVSRFDVVADPPSVFDVGPGQTASFDLRVTSHESAEPGVTQIPFALIEAFQTVDYEVAEPSGCHVKTSRELMIRHPGVVDDPSRTSFDGPPDDLRTGAWTFGRLMERAAPSPAQAAELVERLFNSWHSEQMINSFVVAPRELVKPVFVDDWPRTSDGRLDIQRAPLRLLAITNRFDLRDLEAGHAGQASFIFGLTAFGMPMESFNFILDYAVPTSTDAGLAEWARAWHALSSYPFPSEEYNAALQAITDRFTARGAAPGRQNGSALIALRTNEHGMSETFDFLWQLREFRLGASGFLEPTTTERTPADHFNGSQTLADFVNANEAAIIAERHVVPASFQGAPFLGGASHSTIWSAPNMNDLARHKFSVNTCNGCHSFETQTPFQHVSNREVGEEAQLSQFLTGFDLREPLQPGQPAHMDDLLRRNVDLKAIVCSPEPPAATLRKGISRVH
jgi:hypothetical protein